MKIPVKCAFADDFSMNFFTFGSGSENLVILPGLSVQSVMKSASLIANAYDIMKDKFTVYVFDRRTELPEKYSVYDMARDTAAVMKKLGLHDVCLFGASQGGMIAQAIAIEYPGLVKKLALGSTSSHVDDKQYSIIENWTALAKKKDKTALYLDFGEKIYPPDMFEKFYGMLIFAAENTSDDELARFITIAEGSKDFNVSDKLCQIKCPIMLTGSYDDKVLGNEPTEKMADILRDKPYFRLCMYENYGHAAFDTAPDYKQKLLDFFI